MNDRIIKVKGIGTVSAKPDLIIITMELDTTEFDYQTTMEKAASELDALRTALISAGYEKDSLKTTDFNINTDYKSIEDSRGNWKRKFIGYKCTHKLKLEFDFSMERLNKTLSAIALCPAKPKLEINFSIKDKNAVSEQLLQSAVKNASEKAAVLAQAANLSLGAIKSIDYSWGELILYSDTKFLKPLECCESESASDMDIEPEEIMANESVTIVWEIV